jgi:hypothetical protein
VAADAFSSWSSTVFRSQTASTMVLKLTAFSAMPGTGRVAGSEPGASTSVR